MEQANCVENFLKVLEHNIPTILNYSPHMSGTDYLAHVEILSVYLSQALESIQ